MKLIICKKCTDVVRLKPHKVKYCDCGESSGKYINDTEAWYEGNCIPLGFANSSLAHALKNQPEEGPGNIFIAFVIEKDCKTFNNQNTKKWKDDFRDEHKDTWKGLCEGTLNQNQKKVNKNFEINKYGDDDFATPQKGKEDDE